MRNEYLELYELFPVFAQRLDAMEDVLEWLHEINQQHRFPSAHEAGARQALRHVARQLEAVMQDQVPPVLIDYDQAGD